MSNDSTQSHVSRRTMLLAAGAAAAGLLGQSASPAFAGTQAPGGSSSEEKPMFLPPPDATDAAVHSRAENLFWCEMMADHAGFFATLMPGAELGPVRTQAEGFQRSFQSQYDRARSIDRNSHVAFNRATVEMIKPFIEYKHRMAEAQQSGKMRSLVFPSYFEHTAREAERAVARLDRISAGTVTFEFKEVVDFWSEVMSDHADLIAHLLDPREQELVDQALDSSSLFKGFHHANREFSMAPAQVVIATEELIDFEAALEHGLNAGRIKGILHPAMAGHMHRETLKFIDELKRTSTRT